MKSHPHTARYSDYSGADGLRRASLVALIGGNAALDVPGTVRSVLSTLALILMATLVSPQHVRSNEDDDEVQARRLESQGQMKEAPRLSPDGGTTVGFRIVTRVSHNTGFDWRYTLDGTTPRYSSLRLSNSVGDIVFEREGVYQVKVAGFGKGQKRATRVKSATFTLRTPVLDPPTATPPGGLIWKPTPVVVNSSAPRLIVVRYTLDGSEPSESSRELPYWRQHVDLEKSTTLKLKAFGNKDYPAKPSATATYQFSRENRVLLFLHGMNSEPFKWNDAVSSLSQGDADKPAIIHGGVFENGDSTQDRWGIYHYAVRFGSRDAASASARHGLENAASAIGEHGASGDFTTFANLGAEVSDAITHLISHYQRKNGGSVKVALVGHSRGGLAGRALLGYHPTSQASQAVVALLTLGTPHKGSALGRIYSYLQANPRATDNPAVANDWNVVDWMRLAIDVRTPTTNDLAIGSSEYGALIRLNLPAHVRYGCAVFDGLDFGKLPIGLMYDIFADLPGLINPLSVRCQGWLMNGQSRSAYRGDGIVSASSQSLDGVVRPFIPYQNNSGVAHTNQTGQNDSIRALLRASLNWWN